MPPCMSNCAGRPVSEPFFNLIRSNLSDYNTLSEDIYASKITGLTLTEYCRVRNFYCMNKHINCNECNCMIQAARIVTKKSRCGMSKDELKQLLKVKENGNAFVMLCSSLLVLLLQKHVAGTDLIEWEIEQY